MTLPSNLKLAAGGVEVRGLTKADLREVEILRNPDIVIWNRV